MLIRNYKNLKEAFKKIVKKDREYVLFWHFLRQGEEVKPHQHKKANEFVLIDNGKFKVRLGKEEKTFNLKKKTLTISFPRKQRHGLFALTSISYFVLRDAHD